MRILAIVALAIIGLGLVGYAFATDGGIANIVLRARSLLGLAHQGIEGNATIWYWGVNCLITGGETGMNLNVTSIYGGTVQYPLSWSLRPGCMYVATFHIELHPGRYAITFSTPVSCTKQPKGTFGGISCDLPFDTFVAPGVYSPTVLYVTGGL
jgi:hypothetical protein